jgi:hypothetical protein
MEIPQFTRDEDTYEINPMEWFRMAQEYDMTPSIERNYFFGKYLKWWMSIDNDTKWNITWEEFEKCFSNKWIKDTKRGDMYKIQEDLREAKEEIKKKGDEISKIQDLNEALVKYVQNLKQGMGSKGKWEKDEERE